MALLEDEEAEMSDTFLKHLYAVPQQYPQTRAAQYLEEGRSDALSVPFGQLAQEDHRDQLSVNPQEYRVLLRHL